MTTEGKYRNVSDKEDDDNTGLGLLPVKRKNRARWASLAIFFIIAAVVLAFSIVSGVKVEFHPDPKSYKAVKTNSTTPTVCYVKKEKKVFSGIFSSALGLFSVIIGTLVDRLSLVFEERHHVGTRYGGSHTKMLKACFSGILWGPVLLGIIFAGLTILVFICLSVIEFQLEHLVLILSGIGIGPLVLHLLSLDTESEVHISTIIEKNDTYVANGLAWSYYFNYLEKILPKMKQRVDESNWKDLLSSRKLFILIPLNCNTVKNLKDVDQQFCKKDEIRFENEPYSFDVYCLKVSETQELKYFITQHAEEPLKTLKKMSQNERISALTENKREDEVKLFYRTLLEILEKPLDFECEETCILVPYNPTSGNNAVAKLILKAFTQESNSITLNIDDTCPQETTNGNVQGNTVNDTSGNPTNNIDSCQGSHSAMGNSSTSNATARIVQMRRRQASCPIDSIDEPSYRGDKHQEGLYNGKKQPAHTTNTEGRRARPHNSKKSARGKGAKVVNQAEEDSNSSDNNPGPSREVNNHKKDDSLKMELEERKAAPNVEKNSSSDDEDEDEDEKTEL